MVLRKLCVWVESGLRVWCLGGECPARERRKSICIYSIFGVVLLLCNFNLFEFESAGTCC